MVTVGMQSGLQRRARRSILQYATWPLHGAAVYPPSVGGWLASHPRIQPRRAGVCSTRPSPRNCTFRCVQTAPVKANSIELEMAWEVPGCSRRPTIPSGPAFLERCLASKDRSRGGAPQGAARRSGAQARDGGSSPSRAADASACPGRRPLSPTLDPRRWSPLTSRTRWRRLSAFNPPSMGRCDATPACGSRYRHGEITCARPCSSRRPQGERRVTPPT